MKIPDSSMGVFHGARFSACPRRMLDITLQGLVLLVWVQVVGCRSRETASSAATPMTAQPCPKITKDDVQRIIRRDFGTDQVERVNAILGRYGQKDFHCEPDRVHLAILKMAQGDIEKVESCTTTACSDYRDVLVAAEYRRYADLTWPGRSTPALEQKATEEDRVEYQAWLVR